MARVIWKPGTVVSVGLRDGLSVLAQMHREPTLIFFERFSRDGDWTGVDLAKTPVLFACSVTRQFLKVSTIQKQPGVAPAAEPKLPAASIRTFPGSRWVMLWPGTADEVRLLSLTEKPGGCLVEGEVVHRRSIPLSDHTTIDGHELGGVWTYPLLNERLALCHRLGRNVDPLKDIAFDRPLSVECRDFVRIMTNRTTLSEIGLADGAPPPPPRDGPAYPKAEPEDVLKDVRSPLDKRLPTPAARKLHIIVEGGLTDADAARLARHADGYDELSITVAHEPDPPCDLVFLRHFPKLTGFATYDRGFDRAGELEHLPSSLLDLTIGGGRSRLLSLRFVERLSGLRTLELEGMSKEIEALASLRRLESLSLRSITVADLRFLEPVGTLVDLTIALGGTKTLSALPRIGKLRRLHLLKILGLIDLGFLTELRYLEHLSLEMLARVTRLPSLAALHALRRVDISAMKGLTDLRAIAAAPRLEQLSVTEMKQLGPDAIAPFKGHKTLREATIQVGSGKQSREAAALLGLPHARNAGDFV